MAHTTTARSTYSLLKYSRSYPDENIGNADWQHFTNPVLRLVLDVTRTNQSKTQSVRLKIIWTLQNGGIITLNENSEIVLEDIDLLAFSSLPPGTLMSVPLKAVYRDTTVGIRYLFPVEESNTSTFRRFQMSFVSEQDTSAFISSIRGVCPCKMSTAAASNSQRQLHNPAGSAPNFSMQGSQPSYALAMPETQLLTGNTIQAYPQAYQGGSLAKSTPTTIQTHVPRPSTMPPPPVPSQVLQKSSSAPDLDGSDTFGSQSVNQLPSTPQILLSSHMSSQTAMSSSQTSASAQPIDNTNVPSQTDRRPIQAEQGPPLHPVISALQETSSIYNLPLDVLEHVIGDIIREDEFVSLVEKISHNWKIKTLVVNTVKL